MPSQTTIPVAQTGLAQRSCCEMAPMRPAAKMAKTASTRAACRALWVLARTLVAKKRLARRRALMVAAFQLQDATSVVRGCRTRSSRAVLR